ncbi:MAG TPA: YihY/virulence factor BrkB family protein [Gemmatimonadales bacterium]|nr:YihY/virulence factor BrkB family protein [Gemmatimonadales bacterium]
MVLSIGGYRLSSLVRRTVHEVIEDNILGLAAQTAYYFFFSLFPILLFITPLIGMLIDPRRVIAWLELQLGQTVPPETLQMLTDIVQDVVLSEGAPGLASVGALLALWAGSNVFNTLADALNHAYDVTENRSWWKTRLMAIAMVMLSALVLGVGFVTLIAGRQIISFVAGLAGLSSGQELAWTLVQYSVSVGLLIVLAFLTLYLLPNIRQRKRLVLAGSVVTTALWIGATMLFRIYVVNFGNYNQTYGTIGAVIVLLTWMYLSMLVVLIGGELTSELHKGTGSMWPRRGAVINERIATHFT